MPFLTPTAITIIGKLNKLIIAMKPLVILILATVTAACAANRVSAQAGTTSARNRWTRK